MTTKQKRGRINNWVEVWKPRLLLTDWGITLEFTKENKPARHEGLPLAAETFVDARYKEARIVICPGLLDCSAKFQQACIVHELLHIATDPVKLDLEKAVQKGAISEKHSQDTLEGLTEHVSKIIFKSYNRSRSGDYHL